MTDYTEAALMGLDRVTWPDAQPYLNLAKKYRLELAESAANAVMDALTKETGTKDWFTAPDGYNEPTAWRPNPARPDSPIAVISASAAGPQLWAVLTSGAVPAPTNPGETR